MTSAIYTTWRTGLSPGLWFRSAPQQSDDGGMGDIGVLVADDHRAFVDALTLCLADEPGIKVVAAATSADEALVAAGAGRPDVALLDVSLGGADGIELGVELARRQPGIRLVALSGREDVATVARALRAGFVGWVSKDVGVAELVDVIHRVHRGETSVPGAMLTQALGHVFNERRDLEESRQVLRALTERECDVLREMMAGASRREAADRLRISENTVRTHMQSILAKLGVHSSLAAVALARRAGLACPPQSAGGTPSTGLLRA
jgi:DNA-binding NarL/FixJ family response regulator